MWLMRPLSFAPDEVVVAGATSRVANWLEVSHGRIVKEALPGRLVKCFQVIEYLSTFVLNRLGWGALNGVRFRILNVPEATVWTQGIGAYVEAFAYVFVFAFAWLGLLSAQALILFLCFSFGLNAIVRLLSLVADVLYFRVYPRRSLAQLAVLAFLEAPIYHVAQLPYRMAALFEFLRGQRTHEKMVRTAIARDPHGAAAAAGLSEPR